MKAKIIALILILFPILTSSCYVSNVKTYLHTVYWLKGNIFIVSSINSGNELYINDLCNNLNQRLINSGYESYSYVSDNMNSKFIAQQIESKKPKYILYIYPQDNFKKLSNGFVMTIYSLELYSKDIAKKDTLIYRGSIKISCRYDKKKEIVELASKKIINAVFSEYRRK
ncbi:MAG: hypothetical protein WCR42_10590 [bacterium]